MSDIKSGSYEATCAFEQSAAAQLYARINHHESGRRYYCTDDDSEQSAKISCACGWAVETTTEDDAENQFADHQRALRRRFLP